MEAWRHLEGAILGFGIAVRNGFLPVRHYLDLLLVVPAGFFLMFRKEYAVPAVASVVSPESS